MSITASEIREKYLKFFKSKGHKVVPSDLLVPENDPTLLFTGAGMNQFKEQFMGKNITFSRAASCQKCFRTGDLENVGRTPRHHTFFEMLGNFSFGDYFKKEAIAWGWEFMTRVMGIPEDRIWVSVYEDDAESYNIWKDDISFPENRMVKLGEHDNFWPADAPSKGPNGPCGPCSEIFYDRGEKYGCGGADCGPACECGRFVEVWNLVFTEFERKPDGSLAPLPNKNIDTGMGLERMAAVLQGVETNFDTDLFDTVNKAIEGDLKNAGVVPERMALHRIADHVRASVFAIGDGVSPSNEKQGYVIRKLIRRAYLQGGRKGPFLYRIVPYVVEKMKDVYPELEEKREHITAIIEEEEKRFGDTLDAALPILQRMLASCGGRLEGDKVFKLVDTYGLPLDVIEQESTVPVDVDGFEALMEERKKQSRRGSEITEDFIFQPDKFAGVGMPEYSDEIPLEAVVEFILLDGRSAESVSQGERAEIITSPQSSHFYPEGGGQTGDSGHIEKDGAEIRILDTFDAGGRKVLVVFVKRGELSRGDSVKLALDSDRKHRTALNHTATHLLQAALRKVLGDQVKQSGSSVDDKRLRFDFTHLKKMTGREIEKVEDMVNAWIEEKIPVGKEVKSLEEARAEGALSFFGEKYADTVRVVSVGDRSKELCGGTHVDNTSEIEVLKIIGESSVASGVRRIEAVTGDNARRWVRDNIKGLYSRYKELASSGGGECTIAEPMREKVEGIVSGRIEVTRKVIDEYDEQIRPFFEDACACLEKAAKKKKKKEQAGEFNAARLAVDNMIASAFESGGARFVSGVLEDVGMKILRRAASYAEKKAGNAVIMLGASDSPDKAYLVCSVASSLTDRGFDAKKFINAVSPRINGGGGGKPGFAQAGGSSPSGLAKAISEARNIFEGVC